MLRIFTILISLLLVLQLPVTAQTENFYTSGNTVLISVEAGSGMYEYATNQLLVRFNRNTQKMECIFNLNALLPANDSSPVVIPQDIFFSAKYPEILIEIDAPDGHAQVTSATPQAVNRNARIHLQGLPIDLVIPVNYSPDRRTLLFSTSFDLLLSDYRLSIPARYLPLLTGRVIFTIRNAKWSELSPR